LIKVNKGFLKKPWGIVFQLMLLMLVGVSFWLILLRLFIRWWRHEYFLVDVY